LGFPPPSARDDFITLQIHRRGIDGSPMPPPRRSSMAGVSDSIALGRTKLFPFFSLTPEKAQAFALFSSSFFHRMQSIYYFPPVLILK
jgi:hypothetical protein